MKAFLCHKKKLKSANFVQSSSNGYLEDVSNTGSDHMKISKTKALYL